ncbi:MAG: tetratricopeptide repeat protein [Fimbriiglobus sp.]
MMKSVAWGWVAVAVLAGAGFAPAAPIPTGPTDEQLRERALKLNELTSPDAMQERLTDLLKDKETSKKMAQAAVKLQRAAKGKDQPFKFNAALILAKVAHVAKDYDTAETFYEVCSENATKLQSGPKILQAYDGLMDLYWDQKKFAKVEEVCQKLTEAPGPEAEKALPFVLEKLIQAKAKQGETDKALDMVEGLVQRDEGGWYFLQLKAWVQREAGKFDAAIETYEDSLDKLDDAKQLKDEIRTRFQRNIRYIMTGVYVDANKIDKATAQLEKLVKDDPENPTYYNDLGFILADNDLRMVEAEAFVRKALDLDAKMRQKLLDDGKIDAADAKKENAAYLDSLGWVLFKKKDYKGAVKYLEQAVADKEDEEGQHLEIWDHLADAYLATGDAKKAVATWQKGLKFEDVSKRDVERRKKVSEKLKKAKAELAE